MWYSYVWSFELTKVLNKPGKDKNKKKGPILLGKMEMYKKTGRSKCPY